jgi:RHS repeat-associated protein
MYDTPYREYDNTSGRWLTPDPAGLAAVDLTNPQSLNRYAYVTNNPTTLIDPSGLQGQSTQTCGHGFVVPQGQNPMTWCYNHMGIGEGSSPGAFFTNTADEFDLIWPAGFSGGGNGDTGYFSQGFDPNGALLADMLLDATPSGLGRNYVSKNYGLTAPCAASAGQVTGAVESIFPRFGNYSRWGGLESVAFSPPAVMGIGSTIPITVGIFGTTQNLSITVQSMNTQSMTFTTNPGHLLYPAYITFAASPASAASINFNINLGGTVTSPWEFRFGGSAFEDAQWNHFLGQVGGYCKAGH